MKAHIEWAVVERGVSRGTAVHKSGLASREEAEKWLGAFEVTLARQDRDHFFATDGITPRGELSVAWRVVDHWHGVNEEPPA